MKTCGVDIKGSEAIISLLTLDQELFQMPDCRVRKVTLEKGNDSETFKRFQFTFSKLMQDYGIEQVVIRERPTKGKFAGGAPGFKMEAAIQLIDGIEVALISPTAIKESIKRNPVPVPFAETGLKAFQEGAFSAAYGFLMKKKFNN